MSAHARRGDPDTSFEAAESLSEQKLRESQGAIFEVLATYGPMTQADLVRRYRLTGYPEQSESGIRTRCSELRTMGRVADTGKRVTLPSGRRAVVWAAVR